MRLTHEQHEQLLRGINPSRIEVLKKAGLSLSYLAQHDVRAMLIRIFGFGGFDLTTQEAHLAFEEQKDDKKWYIGYQVTMHLVIRDPYGVPMCAYSETAIGTSTQGQRGEAHDMAMKTASSDAMKRCCINLGDQFGLSLYNNGSTSPIVITTIVGGPGTDEKAPVSDEQPEPVSREGSAPTASPEALAVVAEAGSYIDLPSRERIMNVAKLKTRHPDLLQNVIEVDGQQMTVGRHLDLVAAGRFSELQGDKDE